MTQQTSRKKAARVLLAAGAPIVVAVLGVSLGVAGGSAQADNGQPIILGGVCDPSVGGTNCETLTTRITNTANGDGFDIIATNGVAVLGKTGGSDGVQGITADSSASGVFGDNTGGGKGVFGFSGTGNGVEGGSTSANGVQGETAASAASGVFGENDADGNGVFGLASNSAASGVYGQNDGTGFGVAGRATNGTGVFGEGLTGVRGNSLGAADGVDGTASNGCCSAVYGLNSGSGNGVAGRADTGTGVLAASTGGVALKVSGKAQFSRSGVATVAGTSSAPKNSVRVSLPITAKSMMTALLQKFVAGVYVVAAVPNVTGGISPSI
jgi:hypothetical protein